MAVMASCQNQDEPIPNTGDQVTADFPKGSVVKDVTVKISDENRTRAGEENSFPLWNLSAGKPGSDLSNNLSISYGVYYANGTLFYSKDMEQFNYNGEKTTVLIPLPAGEQSAKIFMWVSKGFADGKRPANIDWEKKSVTQERMPVSNFGCNDDAFCAYLEDIDLTSESLSIDITLKRPFTQVNIITDEFYGPTDKAAASRAQNFLDGHTQIASDFGLLESAEDQTIYVPKTWYWEDDTFDMEASTRNQFFLRNWVGYDTNWDFLTKTYDGEFANLNLTNQDSYFAIFKGVKKRYIGVFYVLSPRNMAKWKDKKTSKTFNECVFRVYNSYSSTPTKKIEGTFDYDMSKANTRWVITNDLDAGGGIFSDYQNFNVSIQENFEGNTYSIQQGTMTDQQ